ncbi:MAG: glutathione S-transferase family protein [Proteobacteria bacterium]|nr:glutathione S-transferase family protein [Pseudomonadota bacterium]
MSLTLHYHPLSSYCWKVLIPLYENGTPFMPHLVDLRDEKERAEFNALWRIGKFPVLQDGARDWMVPESSIIIEYLDQHFPGKTRFIPSDPDLARQTRMRDRFFDLHIQDHMQKIVGDRLRPAGQKDALGVEQARAKMKTALEMVDQAMESNPWAMGDTFTMADCAAAPALWYANAVTPFGDSYKNASAYLARLSARPSFVRVLKEAEPYFAMFPKG